MINTSKGVSESPKRGVLAYLNDQSFRRPKISLIYNPAHRCHFSLQGEGMVKSLIKVAPYFCNLFKDRVPLKEQVSIANESFQIEKEKYMSSDEGKLKKLELQKDPSKRGYFFTRRNFSTGLIPKKYERTKAPRISAKGSTFHGMKKELKWAIIDRLTKNFTCKIVDFDLSGAHANIATCLQGGGPTLLKQMTTSPSFWDERTELYWPSVERSNLGIDKSALRESLKIMLYTSLNGGNPLNPERVRDNLKAVDATLGLSILELDDFEYTTLFKEFVGIFGSDPLVSEVKNLNEICVNNDKNSVFAIDRVEEYKIDSVHQGISRVLQSFEVILLSILVKSCLDKRYLPLSLDHDGVLCLVEESQDVEEAAKKLSEGISEWSEYLLKGNHIQVVPKISSFNGVRTKH